MALKVIMLRHKIDKMKSDLEALRAKDTEFQTREAELEAAIAEIETDEQRDAVEADVDAFDAEKAEHEEKKAGLTEEIEDLENQLAEEERRIPQPKTPEKKKERGVNIMEKINIRSLPMSQRAFDALPMEQRNVILADETVKAFLKELRSMKGQTRAISGGELTIPVYFLDLISENMYRYSKLLNRVRIREVGGQARQTIAGTVPEAVWTEMCAAINELTFEFNQVTLDGYKVAGFVPVCNSLLEDNDINLASWIVEMLSESLGLAMDKAILYGKGAASKMPLGIVTRLAQTSQPAGYPASAPAWVDLHTSNIQSIAANLTGAEFWSALTIAAGNTFTKYSRGNKFWAMNSKTYALLKSKVITFTASGDIAANIFGMLPIIDGDIDILEFMPEGDIVGGYGDLYLVAERAGMTIEASREVQFIQDNTVFKAKRRADGEPVIPGAFVAINIKGQSVTTVMTFAADTANDANLASLSGLTLSPSFDAGTVTYTAATTNTSDTVIAIPANDNAQVVMKLGADTVKNGTAIKWASGANTLTVTVKNGAATKVYTVTVTKS